MLESLDEALREHCAANIAIAIRTLACVLAVARIPITAKMKSGNARPVQVKSSGMLVAWPQTAAATSTSMRHKLGACVTA